MKRRYRLGGKCAVPSCVNLIRLGSGVDIPLCLGHYGRVPEHVKSPLKRALQVQDKEAVANALPLVLKYWEDKDAKLVKA